jgi:thiamine biosynthesis protein ThiS
MNINLNDKQVEIADDMVLGDLLQQFRYKKCAVIINGKHILLNDYSSHILKEEDNVKIVLILGGG